MHAQNHHPNGKCQLSKWFVGQTSGNQGQTVSVECDSYQHWPEISHQSDGIISAVIMLWVVFQEATASVGVCYWQLEAIQRWSAIYHVWPIKNSFCMFLARVKIYTHTKN